MNDELKFFDEHGTLDEHIGDKIDDLVHEFVTHILETIPHVSKQPMASQFVLRHIVTSRIDLILTLEFMKKTIEAYHNDRTD